MKATMLTVLAAAAVFGAIEASAESPAVITIESSLHHGNPSVLITFHAPEGIRVGHQLPCSEVARREDAYLTRLIRAYAASLNHSGLGVGQVAESDADHASLIREHCQVCTTDTDCAQRYHTLLGK